MNREFPAGVDREALAAYCLMLGDDALIFSQRLSEWCSRAPELEEDIALANIALDLLGQARMLLTRAGEVLGPSTRTPWPTCATNASSATSTWRRSTAAPAPAATSRTTIARLLVFSSWRLALFSRLRGSADPVLAADRRRRALKELAYHRDHAAQWTVRLGDGTDESHRRMQAGLERVWPFVDELFATHPVEAAPGRSSPSTRPRCGPKWTVCSDAVFSAPPA